MKHNKTNLRTEYMREDTELTNFMPYPCFLPKSDLSSSARELYTLLLHRANLSRHNRWLDDQGRVFLIYTLNQLSEDLGKSVTTIKSALNELCAVDLLERSRRGCGLANHLYVKLPPENLKPVESQIPGRKSPDKPGPDPPVSFPPNPKAENCLPDSQKTGHNPDGKLTPSKKKEKKDISHLKRRFRNYSYTEGESL